MAGRKGRRGWGRIQNLSYKGRRYQANYVWPPMTTTRHYAPTMFSTRALAEQWLAHERRLIERGQRAQSRYPHPPRGAWPAPSPWASTWSGGSPNAR